MGVSDSHHFRKMVAGCCMVAGPLFALAGFVFSPALKSGSAAQVAEVARHQDSFLLTVVLTLIAVTFVVGATLGFMHMLREREVGYGHIGGALVIVGLLATAAAAGAQMMLWSMVRDGVQPADITAWHSVTHDTAPVVILGIIGWLPAVGFATLAAGLYRAHAVDLWMAACLTLGVLGITLATPLTSLAVGIVGSALFLIGSGSIGMLILRESDADWEHTPEYHGFSPA
jgi:hypothetical protein